MLDLKASLTTAATFVATALTLTLTTTACVEAPQTSGGGPSVLSATDSSGRVSGTPAKRVLDPTSKGVLTFINASTTTVETLDAIIDRRAASSIIAYRDGVDGLYPSSDDAPLTSWVELDSLHHVGPVTLDRLSRHIEAQMVQPRGDELLGLFDGVTFTAREAADTLKMANDLGQDDLDGILGLDHRAAVSIIEARREAPVASMSALSALPHVGGESLELLRDAGRDALCTGADACDEGLTCVGVPADGSDDYGRCRPGCEVDCGWLDGIFVQPAPLTNAGSHDLHSPLVVAGVGARVLEASVSLDLQTDQARDLLVAVEAPGGANYVLFDGLTDPPGALDRPLSIDGIGDKAAANGQWTLLVWNRDDAQVSLAHWSLELHTTR